MSKVLIIDDHPDIRRLVRLTLEFEQHQIMEAVDGRIGLEAARQWKPDIVLLDVMMPGMDGLETCRQLRADPSLAGTRVVLLTARGGSADRSAGLAAGADEYVVKPFSPLTLLQLVEQLGVSA
ncbi:MAG: response regulator [Burkholderiales bacterium]|jgi:two-component system, OmpR family, phosphate regulon response regulator PhoB|nr:response regulator [Burkholderiales bacterium]